MKLTMSVLTCITAPFIVNGSASAGHVGIDVVSKPNELEIGVAVMGTASSPLSIAVVTGTFGVKAFNPVNMGDTDGQPEAPQGPGIKWTCCLTDGTCLEEAPVECIAMGGTPQGPGTTCTPNPCAVGACCLSDGTCFEMVSPSDCITLNGVYQGDGSDCDPNPCFVADTCPWDCDGSDDGNVIIDDFLVLLAQWGTPGSCDFDGGGVGIADFLAVLANWGPCPGQKGDCADPAVCGVINVCAKGDPLDCFCFLTPGGAGACLSDVLCPLVEPCGAMDSCPPGFICAINTCCPGMPDICIPLTGSCMAGAARPGPPITQSGWTASGQYIDAGD